jgi:hypothetical protein
MPNHDREDIVTLFHRLPMASERQAKSFVGVDECLNGREVANLVNRLAQSGLTHFISTLWYKLYESRGGKSLGHSVLGGINKSSPFYGPNSLYSDIGALRKHWSFSDALVAEALVVQFISHNKVVLLSENTETKDPNGLRRLLRDVVRPLLDSCPQGLSLTAWSCPRQTGHERRVE